MVVSGASVISSPRRHRLARRKHCIRTYRHTGSDSVAPLPTRLKCHARPARARFTLSHERVRPPGQVERHTAASGDGPNVVSVDLSERLAVLPASIARPRCGSSHEVSQVHHIEAAAVPTLSMTTAQLVAVSFLVPLLRPYPRAVHLPAAPLVHVVPSQRAGPADRDPTCPCRALHRQPGRGRSHGVLDQHDDARGPWLLPVRPHRRTSGRPDHLRPPRCVAHLLGINARRVSEAAAVRIEDYAEALRGHRVLHLIGKGDKPAPHAADRPGPPRSRGLPRRTDHWTTHLATGVGQAD